MLGYYFVLIRRLMCSACGAIMEECSPSESALLGHLVPLMLNVLRDRVAVADEDAAAVGFEIFDDMVEFVCVE